MTNVVLSGAKHRYGATETLRGIDLVLDRSGITAVLGPSGCGKTTLLRVLAGHERLSAGTLHIDGQAVDADRNWVAPERRGVGLVFQDLALFPHLDVAGNLAFGLHRWTAAQRTARVDELAQVLELGDLLRRLPAELSGGQQQRLALGRALAPRPRLLLLDEPFTALDPALRDRVREDVAAVIRACGMVCVLVTHDPLEALALADRVVVLRDGRVVQDDTPAAVHAHPVDAAVLALFRRVSKVPGLVLGGIVSSALGTWPLAHGDGPAMLCVREDAVHLADAASEPSTTVAARIVARQLLGDAVRYRLCLDDGSEVWSLAAAEVVHASGETCRLSVDVGRIRLEPAQTVPGR